MASSKAQNLVTIEGNYTMADSLVIMESFQIARDAVELMYADMRVMWEVAGGPSKYIREQRWLQNERFMRWLGAPLRIKKSKKIIARLQKKFNRKVTFKVVKDNRGRCRGWISAWTIPFGKVRIRLCEDYFIYRTYLQEKVMIHEMGHEVGMMFHYHIHGFRAARRAAEHRKNIAKKSVENYAWLAMSYTDLDFGH